MLIKNMNFTFCSDTRQTKTLNPKPCRNSIHDQVPEIITASFISTNNPNKKLPPEEKHRISARLTRNPTLNPKP
jgi:hypothetical protein